MNEEIETSTDVLKDYSLLKKIDRFFYFSIKRLFDIVFSLLGIMFLLPISLIVKISYVLSGDYKTIFYTQSRIGYKGKEFKFFKFRTMIPNADKELEKILKENKELAKEYKKNKKLKNDPRITKMGKFLRNSSLDEFPQFINVLKGDMALIGNRPYLPREKKDMGQYYNSIIKCKPGVTGMWQANGRSDVEFNYRCKLDDYYYHNWSIWLDFTIIYKTIKGVVYGKGSL